MKMRHADLEKQRDRALKIPAVTDAAVDDVRARLGTVLETTEPRELKAILAHFIERVEVEGRRATFYCTFAEPKGEIVSVAGDPEGI